VRKLLSLHSSNAYRDMKPGPWPYCEADDLDKVYAASIAACLCVSYWCECCGHDTRDAVNRSTCNIPDSDSGGAQFSSLSGWSHSFRALGVLLGISTQGLSTQFFACRHLSATLPIYMPSTDRDLLPHTLSLSLYIYIYIYIYALY
jgi:hypothetical protein